MMTQEEIQSAVNGVMELRPGGVSTKKHEPKKDPTVVNRMSDKEFQDELDAIMRDEPITGSAFFFKNTDPQKGSNKNINFNPYRGEVK